MSESSVSIIALLLTWVLAGICQLARALNLDCFGSHPGVEEGDLPLLVHLCMELIIMPTS